MRREIKSDNSGYEWVKLARAAGWVMAVKRGWPGAAPILIKGSNWDYMPKVKVKRNKEFRNRSAPVKGRLAG